MSKIKLSDMTKVNDPEFPFLLLFICIVSLIVISIATKYILPTDIGAQFKDR